MQVRGAIVRRWSASGSSGGVNMRLRSVFAERERISHLTIDERGQFVLVLDDTGEVPDRPDLLGDEILDASAEELEALRRAGYLWFNYGD
jgi:hypothetical protein